MEEAKICCGQGLKIARQLSASNPLSEQIQRDVAVSFYKLGVASQAENASLTNALQHYKNGLEIVQRLSEVNPLSQALIKAFRARIAQLEAETKGKS